MGWWRAGGDGSSLHAEDTGLVWGDGPADILDDAIDQITAEFREACGRKPSRAELEAGLKFSLGAYDEQAPAAGSWKGWQEKLDNLKACITGYDLLLADPQPGLAMWCEARDRGRQRIIAACLAVAYDEQEA